MLDSSPKYTNPSFFLTPFRKVVLRSDLATPFTKTDPSKLFVSAPQGAKPDVAAQRIVTEALDTQFPKGVNGIGDLQFQPKAANSFEF